MIRYSFKHRCPRIASLGAGLAGLCVTFVAWAALTGAWTLTTGGGTNSATAPVLGINVSMSNSTAITQANGTFNTTNFWTDPYGGTVAGGASLVVTVPGDTTMRTVTVNFAKAIDNPVLHVDRVGGSAGGDANSSIWTLTGSTSQGGAVSMTRLGGSTQFTVSGASFQRATGVPASGTECSTTDATATACGSIRFNGTGITQLTFQVVMSNNVGSGDALEFRWSFVGSNVVYRKQSIGGTGSFGFTGTNGVGASTLDTSAANPATSSTYAITDNSQPVTITEGTLSTAFNLTSASCVDQATSATVVSTLNAATRVLTIASTAYAGNQTIVCTFVNTRSPVLTLVKTVTNDNGGTQPASAWTLTATGPTTISGATGSAAVTNATVTAGTYALTESSTPGGYTASQYSCVKNGGSAVSGDSIALVNGDVATCTINNNDKPATLTLVKTVTNDNGGTQPASAWTLTATGPTTISGATGSAAVTNAAVSAGTYALSETGPANYVAGAWACTGGTLSGSSLTLGNGQSATCTINNNDSNAADLSVTKTNGTTTVKSGSTTTYTVVASNAGPASGNGAVAKDTPSAGLSGCVAICTGATGGAACPATPSNLLTPAGVAIATFPAGSSVTFQVTCNVN